MAIIKIAKKERNYLVLDKGCLEDKTLSWGARGLHAFLMGKPPDWKVLISALINCGFQKRDAMYGYLKELIKAGYVDREEVREGGRFKSVSYIVHKTKQLRENLLEPESEGSVSIDEEIEPETMEINAKITDTVDPYAVEPHSVKPTLINNNKTKIIKKTTARRKPDITLTEQENAKPRPAVAAFSKNNAKNDALITQTLTPSQQQKISDYVTQHSQNLQHLGTPEEIYQAICAEILNPLSFTQAGSDFSKKLNTLKKMIRMREWRPASLVEKSKKEFNEQAKLIKSIQSKINEKNLHRDSCLNALNEPMAQKFKEHRDSLKRELRKIESGLKRLHPELNALLNDTHELKNNEEKHHA